MQTKDVHSLLLLNAPLHRQEEQRCPLAQFNSLADLQFISQTKYISILVHFCNRLTQSYMSCEWIDKTHHRIQTQVIMTIFEFHLSIKRKENKAIL